MDLNRTIKIMPLFFWFLTYRKIFALKREEWVGKMKTLEIEDIENVIGFIVIDQMQSCDKDLSNILHYKCFRPSYPTSDIM